MLQLNLFPPSSRWTLPKSLPEVKNLPGLSIDLETRDDSLSEERGSGWVHKEGRIVGVSVYYETETPQNFYFPVDRFPKIPEWINDRIRENSTVYLANAQYDLGWLYSYGVSLPEKLFDIQIAQFLLEEERPEGYSLNSLAQSYLNEKKDEKLLNQAAAAFNVHPKKELHKLPHEFVGPYAEADARQTYQIAQKQKALLDREDLWSAMKLEHQILPIMLRMTKEGIRFDVQKAEKLIQVWEKEEKEILNRIGLTPTDIWSTETLARALIGHGVKIQKTDKGNPSVTNNLLQSLDLDFAQLVYQARQLNRHRKTFVEDTLQKYVHRGRIHPHYSTTRLTDNAGETRGTRSGRFSSNHPNEQQIPKRSPLTVDPDTFKISNRSNAIGLGKLIRSLRIPEEGEKWHSLDFDSQEPTTLVHFALAQQYPGAKEALSAFNRGEKLYRFIEQSVPGISYDKAKATFLAKCYRQTAERFSRDYGIPLEESEKIFQRFEEKFPFVTLVGDSVMQTARSRGYLLTYNKARIHFPFFESRKAWDYRNRLEKLKQIRQFGKEYEDLKEKIAPVYGEERAKEKFPEGYQRAFIYKALNRLLQRYGAEQNKLALVGGANSGIRLRSTVHDEINISGTEDEGTKMKRIMIDAMQLNVPIRVELETGDHW